MSDLNKRLINAILANNLERVKKLLADGADPNFYDGSLHEPPRYGVTQSLMVDLATRPDIQIGILEALLDAGADVQRYVRDPYASMSRSFIFTQAAHDRRYDILKLILSKLPDYDMDERDPYYGESFRESLLRGRFPFEITLWAIANNIVDPGAVAIHVEPEETYEQRIPAYVRVLKNLFRHQDIRPNVGSLKQFLERIFNSDIATEIVAQAMTDKTIQAKHAINRRKHLLASMSRIGGRRRGRRNTKRHRRSNKN